MCFSEISFGEMSFCEMDFSHQSVYSLLVGEVTFTNDPLGYDVLSRLKTDASFVDWTPPSGGEPDYQYVLFSRSGYKPSVEEAAAERDDMDLFSLDDVVEVLLE